MLKIAFQTEGLKHPRIDAKRDGRITALHAVQGLSRNAGTLRHGLRRIGPAQPRLADMRAESTQQAHQARQQWRNGSCHNGSYLTR